MLRTRNLSTTRRRRGGALLIALALLALGSALLVGAASAARAATRAEETLEAVAAVESELRVVLAEALAAWDASLDSMPVGAFSIRPVSPRRNGFGAVEMRSAVRIQRIGATRFVIAASTQAGPAASVAARRRGQLLVEQVIASDTLAPMRPPSPIVRWSTSELY
jgi:hypothetical protein